MQVVPVIFREFRTTDPEYADALRLRESVLRTPLGLSLDAADLVRDAACFHLGGFSEGGKLAAVLLLQRVEAGTLQMRQVAVFPALQGTGIGTRLVAFAEAFARERGFTSLLAHARGTALGFYLKRGYAASGDEFTEQTIPHRLVTKAL